MSSQISVINVNTLSVVKNISVLYPYDIAYDPNNGEFYVSESSLLKVAILSNDVIIKNITINGEPGPIIYDPANSLIYVAGIESDSVYIINPLNNSVVNKIPIYGSPSSMIYANGNIYVTSLFSGIITVISKSNSVSSIPITRGIFGIAYDTKDGYLYITDIINNSVIVLNNGNFVTSISVGDKPSSIILINNKVYVTDAGNNIISCFHQVPPPPLIPLSLLLLIVIAIAVVSLATIYSIRRR
jgi:YVTN family beta-propeller protein